MNRPATAADTGTELSTGQTNADSNAQPKGTASYRRRPNPAKTRFREFCHITPDPARSTPIH